MTSTSEAVLSGLQAEGEATASGPIHKSQETIKKLTSVIDALSADFAVEMKGKSQALEQTRANLRASTRELAEQRKQLAKARQRLVEMNQMQQRIKNLERASAEVDAFDWTGRTELNGSPVVSSAAFQYRGQQQPVVDGLDVAEPRLPTDNSMESLVRLRRTAAWHERILALLRQRAMQIKGSGAELEVRYKKIVAACCNMPVDQVDSVVEALVAAMESDGEELVSRRLTFVKPT